MLMMVTGLSLWLMKLPAKPKIFPKFSNLQPTDYINTDFALEYIKNEDTFPKDDTHFVLTNGSSLFGSTHHNNTTPTSPKPYLSHVHIQRNIVVGGQVYPVCGPGSKASFGFAVDGNAHSLSYRWKPATLNGRTVQSRSTDFVYRSICKQLEFQAANASVTVDSVSVRFYDSGLDYIQPVYRFTATVFRDSTNSTKALTAGIQGFIPLGESLEIIPDITNSTPRPAPASVSPFRRPPRYQKKTGVHRSRLGGI